MQTQNIPSDAATGKRGVTDSSAMAYDAIGNKDKQKQQNDIFAICVREQNNGASNLTNSEISRLLEDQRSMAAGQFVRVNPSSITGAIDRLKVAGRLVRTSEKRVCSMTSQRAYGLFVPMTQTRLVA